MSFSGLSTASIINFGTINAAQGNVFAFAQRVENQGYIGAVDGHVVMLGGNEVLLHQGGSNGNISVKGTVGYGHVHNDGVLEGAQVTMQAVNNNAMAMAVQQNGAVRITGVEKRDGRVLLVANGGAGVSQQGVVNTAGGAVRIQSEGQVQIGGTTDASRAGGAGGEIEVIGREINITPDGLLRANGSTGGTVRLDGSDKLDMGGSVEVMGSAGQGGTASLTGNEVLLRTGAVVDASGTAGGGQIAVGGGFQGMDPSLRNSLATTVESGAELRASATESGNGGQVVVWSDGNTNSWGDIRVDGVGNGGLAEVSALGLLGFGGTVNLQGGQGNNGLLLLDPINVHIGQINDDPTTGDLSTGQTVGGFGFEYAGRVLPAGIIDATALQTAWELGQRGDSHGWHGDGCGQRDDRAGRADHREHGELVLDFCAWRYRPGHAGSVEPGDDLPV
jgi:hypothetical protein